MNKRLSVESFIRDIDLVSQNNRYTSDEISWEDQRALKLVQRLGSTDFSVNSCIRNKLRSQLAKRSIKHPMPRLYYGYFSFLNNIRVLMGTGIAIFFISVIIFGFLTPQHVPAIPYVSGEISPGISSKPVTSLTTQVTHKQVLVPKPIPTPLAGPTFEGNSTLLPSSTPSRLEIKTGNQFPIYTITLSK